MCVCPCGVVQASGFATSKGISFLEVKLQLMLCYVTNLAFYMLLKAEGRPVKDHPVLDQILRTRYATNPRHASRFTACMLNVFAADAQFIPGPCWSVCGPWMPNCSTKSTACSSHQRAQTCKEDKPNLVSCTAAPASHSPVGCNQTGPTQTMPSQTRMHWCRTMLVPERPPMAVAHEVVMAMAPTCLSSAPRCHLRRTRRPKSSRKSAGDRLASLAASLFKVRAAALLALLHTTHAPFHPSELREEVSEAPQEMRGPRRGNAELEEFDVRFTGTKRACATPAHLLLTPLVALACFRAMYHRHVAGSLKRST